MGKKINKKIKSSETFGELFNLYKETGKKPKTAKKILEIILKFELFSNFKTKVHK